MTFDERQQLLRLVIERITVENGVARIDTVIPPDQDNLRNRYPELVEGPPRPLEPKRYVEERGVRQAAYQRPNEALSLLLRRYGTGQNPGMGSFQQSEP